MEKVKFSVRGEEDFLEHIVTPPAEHSASISQTDRAPSNLANSRPLSPRGPLPPSPEWVPFLQEQGTAGAGAMAEAGGLSNQSWAALFQENEHLLHPVLPWLRRELEAWYPAPWWLAARRQSYLLQALCYYGLDKERLVNWMQNAFHEDLALLVHDLVNLIEQRCHEEAWRVLNHLPDRAVSPIPVYHQQETPNSSQASSSSPSGSSVEVEEEVEEEVVEEVVEEAVVVEEEVEVEEVQVEEVEEREEEEEASPSEATSHSFPGGSSPSASTPAEPEEPRDMPEEPQEVPEEVAATDPSAQGCSGSPSAPSQGRDHSPREPRQPTKRRVPSLQEPPQPSKRQCCRQHSQRSSCQ